jgi:hypothetical protein
MADTIQCPLCGNENQANSIHCTRCGFQIPKVNSEKAEQMPDWLNNLRAFSDDKSSTNIPPLEDTQDTSDNEEIPDWLSKIRDRKTAEEEFSKISGLPNEKDDSAIDNLVSSFRSEPETEPEHSSNQETNWLNQFRSVETQSVSKSQQNIEPDNVTPGQEEIPDWFSRFSSKNPETEPDIEQTTLRESEPKFKTDAENSSFSPVTNDEELKELPNRLDTLGANSKKAQEESTSPELPEWLSNSKTEDKRTATPATSPKTRAEEQETKEKLPDWVKNSTESDFLSEINEKQQKDTPEWLTKFSNKVQEPESEQEIKHEDIPAWLSGSSYQENDAPLSLQDEEIPEWLNNPTQPTPQAFSNQNDASWLDEMEQATTSEKTDESPAKPKQTLSDSPKSSPPADSPFFLEDFSEFDNDNNNLLNDLGLEKSQNTDQEFYKIDTTQSQELTSTESEESHESPFSHFEELPSWLADQEPSSLEENLHEPPLITSKPSSILDRDIEAPDDQTPASAPFMMDNMPDWLGELDAAEEGAKQAAQALDEKSNTFSDTSLIEPAQLPGWLRAMRPVEAVSPQEIRVENKRKVEKSGPLAGLQGVLSSEDAAGRYSPPPIYNVRLNITEKQKIHAGLLENIFTEDKKTISVTKSLPQYFQKVLRFLIPAILLFVLITSLFLDTTSVKLPHVFKQESNRFTSILNNLMLNPEAPAKILIIIDADASSVAEIRTMMKSVFENLFLLNSKMDFMSTNLNGVLIADNLIESLIYSYPSINNSGNMANHGYIPGDGLAAQNILSNPKQYMDQTAAEKLPQSINSFSAILLITDNAENGKLWIEQMEITQLKIPKLIAVTNQAAPLLQPYADSSQIDGMISGLYGGISYQQLSQNNTGFNLKYWNSYQYGIILFIVIILAGGAWQLFVFAKKLQNTEKRA